jgi:large subunit ribosomal protein L15
MFTLSNLPKTVTKASRRIGRGIGSGKGKNAGHGHKGQLKRKGGKRLHVGFEGGQASLIKRIPKYRGYNNNGKKNLDLSVLTTGVLERFFKDGDAISIPVLLEKSLVSDKINRVRIIKNGHSTKNTYTFSEEIYLTKGAQIVLK